MEISRKVFNIYKSVHKLGIVKMRDVSTVASIAKVKFFSDITEEEILYISAHYNILIRTYEEDD